MNENNQKIYNKDKGSSMLLNYAPVTISSREIAVLVESRHDKVKQSIERLAKRGAIRLPPMGDFEEINNLGAKVIRKLYQFAGEQGKRDSIIVVAQLCPEFTARLVDRWQELETRVAKITIDPMEVLSDPTALRGLLSNYSERVINLQNQVQEMQPDIDAFKRIAKSEGGICITVAAKELQIQPKALFKYLSSHHWIYRRVGGRSWLAYQPKIQTGLLEHKVTLIAKTDGSEKVSEQVLITPKGLTKLSRLLNLKYRTNEV